MALTNDASSPKNEASNDSDVQISFQFPAIRYTQGDGRILYSFVADGKQLRQFTTISRVKRDEKSTELLGYQRPEVVNHIKKIQDYVESENPLMPNSLVIALKPELIEFAPLNDSKGHSNAELGTLTISRPHEEGHLQPGWIVDGQQRTAAISQALENPKSEIESFPVSIVGFEADDQRDQRTQFILVNSTKPLPNSLIHEMLPSVEKDELPLDLQAKIIPYTLIEYLNFRDDSPLKGKIKTQTLTEGVAKDNSFATMLHASIEHGFLYSFWHLDRSTGDCDIEMMYTVVSRFWAAVSKVFPKSWDKKPSESRLLHGVGILALGNLMDDITFKLFNKSGFLDQRDTLYPYEEYTETEIMETLPTIDAYVNELLIVKPFCAWDSGAWQFEDDEIREWDSLQNLSQDKRKLSKFLGATYARESKLKQ